MLGYALTPKHVMLDFLGHEQETTTIKHYLRAFREAKARAREGIAVEEQILQARSLFEPDVADRLGERWIGSRTSGAVRAEGCSTTTRPISRTQDAARMPAAFPP
jgi:hypothetical protein